MKDEKITEGFEIAREVCNILEQELNKIKALLAATMDQVAYLSKRVDKLEK